uniref:mRNA interferase RelE/StbE n=1 Tax=Candidatus Kentrum sp. LFY TaxID=2126342 RepID=A0A450UT91_9GAMM|nr:MAG: mRNA interferase RelE/StbE [Candidatus Kentron sp. LFY]
MAYRITFKKSVARDLRRIGRTEAERVLSVLAKELPRNATLCPELKGKFAGLRKFRVGNYRIIFAIMDDSVLVTRIGHRRDVYKTL